MPETTGRRRPPAEVIAGRVPGRPGADAQPGRHRPVRRGPAAPRPAGRPVEPPGRRRPDGHRQAGGPLPHPPHGQVHAQPGRRGDEAQRLAGGGRLGPTREPAPCGSRAEGQALLEAVVPAWRQAQEQAGTLIGGEAAAALGRPSIACGRREPRPERSLLGLVVLQRVGGPLPPGKPIDVIPCRARVRSCGGIGSARHRTGKASMTKLDDHPSVVRFRRSEPRPHPGTLDADRLRQLCLDAGADDVGFVAIDRPELDDQRAEILGLYPWTKGLISVVCRMNREPIRSPARSVANLEFHHAGDRTNEVAHADRRRPGGRGASGRSTRRWASRWRWTASPARPGSSRHKPVAVAAGLGRMGIHRNVIHPKFGNFILLAHDPDRRRGLRAVPARSTTTRAWSASSAWRPARSGPSPRTATSTSRPA